jgi:hypothetical protein
VGGGFSPLDEELGLLPQIVLTPTLAESAVRLGTWLPFEVAATMLAHFVHTQVSEPTLTRLTERAGAAYVAVQEAQAARLAQGERGVEEAGPPLQQVSVDGAMVPLVHKVWVEAKTLAIGTVQPPKQQADGSVEIRTTDLSYFSRVAEWHDFSDQASIETVRRGTLTAGRVVGIVDGAVWEQAFLDEQCPDAVRILDWPHAVSYLTPVAHALYGVDTSQSKAWLAAQKETLLHGDPQGVLAKLRGLQADLAAQAAADQPPPPALAVVTDSLDYLAARADQLRYAAFRAAGYPIGSGAVESANKLLVEARLKGAGRHWAPAHVNPLLALRSLACSDRWEEGWPQLRTQWRREARNATLAHRRARHVARAAARQTAADHAVLAAGIPRPAAPHVPSPAPVPLAPQPPAHRAAQTAPPVPPPVPRRTRAACRRPAANHPWRRQLLHRATRADPEM